MITYQGTPLNSGRIYLTINRGEVVCSASIEQDGTYVAKGLAVGEAQLAVVVPPAYRAESNDPTAPGFGHEPSTTATDPVVIPERYAEISTSGLTLTVKSGSQSHDIDLE